MFSSSLCLTSIISFLYFYSFHLRLLPIPCIHNITTAATSFHRLHPSMCVHQWINVKLETSKLSPNELSCCIKKIIHFHWWYWWMDDCRNEKIFLLYGETETKKNMQARFPRFPVIFWRIFMKVFPLNDIRLPFWWFCISLLKFVHWWIKFFLYYIIFHRYRIYLNYKTVNHFDRSKK